MRMLSTRLYWNARTALAWGLAIIAAAYFAASDGDFLGKGNLYALLQNFAVLVLVAVGLAVVMIAAQFDLSIAGTFPMAGLIVVKYAGSLGVAPSLLIALAAALAVGGVNGVLIGFLRIPSLAVTVATMVLSTGIGYLIAGQNLVTLTNYKLSLRLTEPVLEIFSIMSLIEISLAVLACVWLKVTWRGRFFYAAGSDDRSARSSGLPIATTILIGFLVSALFAGIGGSLQALSLATGQAGSADSFLLQCATAALIGGVTLSGGRGSLVGVVGGALLLAVLTNGLGLAGVDSPVIQLVNGLVLVAIVVADKPLNRLTEGRLRREFEQADEKRRLATTDRPDRAEPAFISRG